MRNTYIGHPLQLGGVEELRLTGGRGDGMRMLLVRNAMGLEFMVSLDRCADVVRLSYRGVNCGYLSPCGYVAPTYYDRTGNRFLRSFSAGFFTTCGLDNVGVPCEDDGESLPLHGTISHAPAENVCHWVENDEIHIRAVIRDAAIFAHKLELVREYTVPMYENRIMLCDTITNVGSDDAPLEVLYHCNMGYPLLSETAVVNIPAQSVRPRSAHAAEGMDARLTMEKPQRGYEEMCYFYDFKGESSVSVTNHEVGVRLSLSFNADELPYFTEWKMMGEYDYVLGLEPGNCHPDGRAKMREEGALEILPPDGVKTHRLTFTFTEV